MPSVSKAQHAAMGAAASGHSTLGIPKSVGQDFVSADKGHQFGHGGSVEHKQLAKQARARVGHAKGTGQDYDIGGYVGGMGTSVSQAPPPGHRTPGPTNYGKK